jgi:hypothetical protein
MGTGSVSSASVAFLFVFFVSGFTALVYQIVWQRMLSFFGGADVYSVTIIVSAFMGGLGFGSLAGGYLADRLGARGRLLAFASCELAIAVFAVFSATIYYDVLYLGLGSWAMPRAAMAAIIFGVTLWPTFFMGMSLPLLATAMTHEARQPARWVPVLYGWNTLGAACGSLFAAAILFRAVDLVTSVRVGATLSAACALGALLVAPRLVRGWSAVAEVATPKALVPVLDSGHQHHFSLSTWIAIYALSGFIALSLEIVWFRILGVILKANSFTFGHLLGVYLAGVGLGSLVASSRLARSWQPARAFLLLQAAIPSVAVISLTVFVMFVHQIDVADPLWQYLGRYETLSSEEVVGSGRGLFFALYVAVPIGLMGLPTLMMGLSFGHLQRAVQTDLATLGRRVGWLQTANIAGSMVGAMLTGLVLLDVLGSAGTLQLLVLCSTMFILLYGHVSPAGVRGGDRRLQSVSFALLRTSRHPRPHFGPDCTAPRQTKSSKRRTDQGCQCSRARPTAPKRSCMQTASGRASCRTADCIPCWALCQRCSIRSPSRLRSSVWARATRCSASVADPRQRALTVSKSLRQNSRRCGCWINDGCTRRFGCCSETCACSTGSPTGGCSSEKAHGVMT